MGVDPSHNDDQPREARKPHDLTPEDRGIEPLDLSQLRAPFGRNQSVGGELTQLRGSDWRDEFARIRYFLTDVRRRGLPLSSAQLDDCRTTLRAAFRVIGNSNEPLLERIHALQALEHQGKWIFHVLSRGDLEVAELSCISAGRVLQLRNLALRVLRDIPHTQSQARERVFGSEACQHFSVTDQSSCGELATSSLVLPRVGSMAEWHRRSWRVQAIPAQQRDLDRTAAVFDGRLADLCRSFFAKTGNKNSRAMRYLAGMVIREGLEVLESERAPFEARESSLMMFDRHLAWLILRFTEGDRARLARTCDRLVREEIASTHWNELLKRISDQLDNRAARPVPYRARGEAAVEAEARFLRELAAVKLTPNERIEWHGRVFTFVTRVERLMTMPGSDRGQELRKLLAENIAWVTASTAPVIEAVSRISEIPAKLPEEQSTTAILRNAIERRPYA